MRKTHGIRQRQTARTAALAVLLVTVLCLAAAPANAAVVYNANVNTMITNVTQAQLQPVVNELSGETPAFIFGSPYTILTRGSSSGVPIDMAEQYIYEHLLSYGLDSVSFQDYPGKGGGVKPGRNIIGQINGTTKPNEIIVIGCHIDDQKWGDPLAPGADDDASGTSAVLYLARSFADKNFARTIRFCFFGSEENASWGSNMFGAGYYANQCKLAGQNIVGMVEADALAYNAGSVPKNGRVVALHRRMKSNAGEVALYTMWKDVFAAYSITGLDPQDWAYSMKYSDHGAFWNYMSSTPAVLLIEEDGVYVTNPNWHTPNDKVSTFNWPYYVSVTKSLVGLAAHQAQIQ